MINELILNTTHSIINLEYTINKLNLKITNSKNIMIII